MQGYAQFFYFCCCGIKVRNNKLALFGIMTTICLQPKPRFRAKICDVEFKMAASDKLKVNADAEHKCRKVEIFVHKCQGTDQLLQCVHAKTRSIQ